MNIKSIALACGVFTLALASTAQAQTDIQWWHSMTAVNGEWVNDLAKDFNASQKDYRIVPTSNTCRMCGALPARKAAIEAVIDSS